MIARWFWREWRSPSLLIVWLALSLAVACVLALGSISDRMEKGLSQQSREFMAGDRTLRSSREVPAEWIAQARKSGLTVGEQLSFATMTFAGDTPQLADVKAVDDRYPLYGTLETQPPGLKPQAGSVLLAPRLMALLNLKTGDTIDVGDATLRIAGEVIQEPDAGFNPFQMAPRLMMNMADVAKTGAVQPGSRVAWRYKFAGDAEQLANYEQWLLPKLGPEHRWIGLDQDDSALGKSLERSQQFLLLSALLTLLLAVAAVAVAMSHYCRSRYDLVAILKTLGAGRSQLRKLIVGQWLLLLTLSVITGGGAGLALERLLLLVLKPVLPAALPAASGWPWLWAIGATGVISLLVGLRPYRLLLATLPLRVLRQDVVANVWPLKIWIPAVSVVVVGLLAWLLGGSPLLWSVLAGAVVLYLLGRILKAERLRRLFSGRFGRILRLKPEDVDKATAWFVKYEKKAVLICRCVPIVRSLISIPAGIAEMNVPLFLLLTAVGSAVWNTVLVTVGSFLGNQWENALPFFEKYSDIILVIAIILVVVFLIWWFGFRGRGKKANAEKE